MTLEVIDPLIREEYANLHLPKKAWTTVFDGFVNLRTAQLLLMKASHLHPNVFQLYSPDEMSEAARDCYVSEEESFNVAGVKKALTSMPRVFIDLLQTSERHTQFVKDNSSFMKDGNARPIALFNEIQDSISKLSASQDNSLLSPCIECEALMFIEFPLEEILSVLDALYSKFTLPLYSYIMIRYYAELIASDGNTESIRIREFNELRERVKASSLFERALQLRNEADKRLLSSKTSRSYFEYVYNAYLACPVYKVAKRLFQSAQWRFQDDGRLADAKDAESEEYAAEEFAASCGEVVASFGSSLVTVPVNHLITTKTPMNELSSVLDYFRYLHKNHPAIPDFAMRVVEEIVVDLASSSGFDLIKEYRIGLLSRFHEIDHQIFRWADEYKEVIWDQAIDEAINISPNMIRKILTFYSNLERE